MYKIQLEIASNGVVKSIYDDNHNGNSEKFESKTVYQLEDDSVNMYDNTISFLYDVCTDLGIDLGNKRSRNVLSVKCIHGDSYIPSERELKDMLKEYQDEISSIKELLKELKNSKIE